MTSSADGPPRRGHEWSRTLATRILRLLGWEIVGPLPEQPRAVLIVAPHTSNWDFPICMLAMMATGLRISWIGKHSIFFFPAAPVLRWLGGEPVNRRVRADRVHQAVARIRESEQYLLGITPEGTRNLVIDWKSGFWAIAQGADVPIIPVVLDWQAHEVRITAAYTPTEDMIHDLHQIRSRYRATMARRPERFAELPAPPP